MKNQLQKIAGILIALVFFANVNAQNPANNWTHFRGNELNGIADKNIIPTIWNDSTNIIWKVPVHDKGWSSPVVYGNQIWTTTASVNGDKMYAVCFDLETGELIHDILVFESDSVYRKHGLNSYATPTPCIERGFVYVHFGRYGTACLNSKTGEIKWTRTDLECTHVQGPASSPFLYKDLLILHLEGRDVQLIVALDKKTGNKVWETHRTGEYYEPLVPPGRSAYITPIIVNVKGRDQLISNGSAVCNAYDPETGEEIWEIVKGENATIAMPVEEDGIVYFYAGFITTPEGDKYSELLAVNPDGKGDIAESNILWSIKSPTLQMLTPVIIDGLLYTLDTKNNMQCIDAKTGNLIWSEKFKTKFNSSPVFADGKIYFSDIKGNTLVIKKGRKYELVSENKLTGQIWATPALSDNSIIIRTSEYLYKIAENFN